MCHCYNKKPVASELRFMKRYTNGNEVVCFIMLMCHINHRKEIHVQGDSEGACQTLWVVYLNEMVLSEETLVKIDPVQNI